MARLLKINSLTLIIALLSLLVFSTSLVKSQETQATPESSVTDIDSFSLFWPLVSGKTEADSFYFLKLFKENVASFIIFNDTKKADYAVLLGTKRVLEAEKLIKEGKNDIALKSLDRARNQYISAYKYAQKAHDKEKFSPGEVRRDRLINIKTLIDSLKSSSPVNVQAKLEEVKKEIDALLRDYLANVNTEALISDILH